MQTHPLRFWFDENPGKNREIWAKSVKTFAKSLKIWVNSLKIRAKMVPNAAPDLGGAKGPEPRPPHQRGPPPYACV